MRQLSIEFKCSGCKQLKVSVRPPTMRRTHTVLTAIKGLRHETMGNNSSLLLFVNFSILETVIIYWVTYHSLPTYSLFQYPF